MTGNYTQTSTGALRMFVGGNTAANFGPSKSGGTYSQLFVDKAVTLDGTLEVVLQPELFSQFNYDPKVGDTFDFVMATGGITLASTLQYDFFVTQAGESLLSGYKLTPYSSGISGDPDTLFQITANLFDFSLIDNGTVLQATLEMPLNYTAAPVPLPPSIVLVVCGVGGLGLVARRRRTWQYCVAA